MAARVIERNTVKMGNAVLSVKPLDPRMLTRKKRGSSGPMPSAPGYNSIEVQGLPLNSREEELRDFFENTRRSGGGDVKKIIYNGETNSAVIIFHCADGENKHVDTLDSNVPNSLSLTGSNMNIAKQINKRNNHIPIYNE